MQVQDGDQWGMVFANPTKLLQKVLEHNDTVHEVFLQTLEAYSNSYGSGWDVVYGLDEC